MRIARNLLVLLFCLNLYALYSCTVDELDDGSNQNQPNKVLATDDDGTPLDPADPPGGNN